MSAPSRAFVSGRGRGRGTTGTLFVLAMLWAQVAAQTPLVHLQLTGSSILTDFGRSVAGVGDVNGDGRGDVLVGAGGVGTQGMATVFSGLDGSIIHALSYGGVTGWFGSAVSGIGDVDGDGVRDFLVSAPGAYNSALGASGIVYLFSGQSGLLIQTFSTPQSLGTFGASVAGIHDMDGDGFPDVLVGAIGYNCVPTQWGCPPVIFPGQAFIFSSASGAVIAAFNGAYTYDDFGALVDALGDVDGDGVNDFAVGGRGVSNTGLNRVYSGATGTVIAQAMFPGTVRDAGDVNADGFGDIAVTRIFASSVSVAYIIAGLTGNVLYSYSGSQFGAGTVLRGAVGAGDINGDGFGDIILLSPEDVVNGSFSCSLRTMSGATGALLYQVICFGWPQLGYSADSCGDATGDGIDDVVVGAPGGTSAPGAGRAYIYAGPGTPVGPCAAGNVGFNGTAGIQNVLGASVGAWNPTFGLPSRRLLVPSGAPSIAVRLAAAPAGPAPAHIVLFAALGGSLTGPSFSLPGIGSMCFPPAWAVAPNPALVVLGDSFGLSGFTLPMATAQAGGTVLFAGPPPIGPLSVLIQAVMQDASGGLTNWRVTNAIEIVFQ